MTSGRLLLILPLAKLVMGLPRTIRMGSFQLNFRVIRLQWKGMLIYPLIKMLDSSIQGYPASISSLRFRWMWPHAYHLE